MCSMEVTAPRGWSAPRTSQADCRPPPPPTLTQPLVPESSHHPGGTGTLTATLTANPNGSTWSATVPVTPAELFTLTLALPGVAGPLGKVDVLEVSA
jgi:hypothetical protein